MFSLLNTWNVLPVLKEQIVHILYVYAYLVPNLNVVDCVEYVFA